MANKNLILDQDWRQNMCANKNVNCLEGSFVMWKLGGGHLYNTFPTWAYESFIVLGMNSLLLTQAQTQWYNEKLVL